MKGDQHIGGQHKIDGDYNHHQRIREKLSQPEPIVTALEFLKKLRPPGPWVLTAIKPNGPAETITARNGDEVRDFIAKHHGRRNLYYSVNPTKTTPTTKPSKADIAAAEFIHADLDPRDDETPEKAKRRYRQRLDSFRPKPTAIIDSGNGLQALWRLDPPVSAKHFDGIEAWRHRGKIRCWRSPARRDREVLQKDRRWRRHEEGATQFRMCSRCGNERRRVDLAAKDCTEESHDDVW